MKPVKFLSVPIVFAVLALTGGVNAADSYGTADQAKAMLNRAVAEVSADKVKALAEFNGGQNGFKDRDLYVFCFNAGDGKLTAHPTLVGKDVRTLKDAKGMAFGSQMYSQASVGTISQVDYLWPRPGTTEPIAKEAFFTKVGDQICSVGYYK